MEQKIKFKSKEHEDFYTDMILRSKTDDIYSRSFFYVMGISGDTRRNIHKLFDFANKSIITEGLYAGWQTSSTLRICRLAFNLWCGYAGDEEDKPAEYTPDNIFCCSDAPYFVEGLKIKHPRCFDSQSNERVFNFFAMP